MLSEDVQEALDLRMEADEKQATAKRLTAEACQALHDRGVSLRDIGTIFGMSHQRVHQILGERGN